MVTIPRPPNSTEEPARHPAAAMLHDGVHRPNERVMRQERAISHEDNLAIREAAELAMPGANAG